MSAETVLTRTATADDVDAIAELLAGPAAQGLVLPRSKPEILEVIADFLLAEADGNVIGCVALRDYGAGLKEVRSLVVRPEFMNRLIGSQLVEGAITQAESDGAKTVFALTYHPKLFERLGFFQVEKELFPQKVWLDCSKCRKRDHCDEIALLYQVS